MRPKKSAKSIIWMIMILVTVTVVTRFYANKAKYEHETHLTETNEVIRSRTIRENDNSQIIKYTEERNMTDEPDAPSGLAVTCINEEGIDHGISQWRWIKRHRNTDFIFYNRIEKTGSENTISLFQTLALQNHFKLYFDYDELPLHNISIHHFLSEVQESQFISDLMELKRPLIYTKHLNYLPLKRSHESVPPKFINVVREPIQRAISAYNYKRYRRDRPHPMPPQQRNMTMDECISKKAMECNAPQYIGVYIVAFCGNDPVCSKVSGDSLQLAKRNIESEYLMVGYLEKIDEFYQLLETTIPRLFTGLVKLFSQRKKSIKNKTERVDEPSIKNLKILKDRLKYDYELYEFIKQRSSNIMKGILCREDILKRLKEIAEMLFDEE